MLPNSNNIPWRFQAQTAKHPVNFFFVSWFDEHSVKIRLDGIMLLKIVSEVFEYLSAARTLFYGFLFVPTFYLQNIGQLIWEERIHEHFEELSRRFIV